MWWHADDDAIAEAQEDLDAALAMLERRRDLRAAHRDQNLKIWDPPETEDGWLATWVGPPQPGEHREASEGALYDWLEAALDGVDEWLRAHPGAEVHAADGGLWEGSYPLSGGARLRTPRVPRRDLGPAMSAIARQADACKRLEADFPGWLAGITPGGEWFALLAADGDSEVKAPDEAGLRAALAAAVAASEPGLS